MVRQQDVQVISNVYLTIKLIHVCTLLILFVSSGRVNLRLRLFCCKCNYQLNITVASNVKTAQSTTTSHGGERSQGESRDSDNDGNGNKHQMRENNINPMDFYSLIKNGEWMNDVMINCVQKIVQDVTTELSRCNFRFNL